MALLEDYENKAKISLFFKRNIFKNNLFVKYTLYQLFWIKKEKQFL